MKNWGRQLSIYGRPKLIFFMHEGLLQIDDQKGNQLDRQMSKGHEEAIQRRHANDQ